VNVAARLEALAEPGAINVSQVILDQVRGATSLPGMIQMCRSISLPPGSIWSQTVNS
jgi:class 3 adenylate cyclase